MFPFAMMQSAASGPAYSNFSYIRNVVTANSNGTSPFTFNVAGSAGSALDQARYAILGIFVEDTDTISLVKVNGITATQVFSNIGDATVPGLYFYICHVGNTNNAAANNGFDVEITMSAGIGGQTIGLDSWSVRMSSAVPHGTYHKYNGSPASSVAIQSVVIPPTSFAVAMQGIDSGSNPNTIDSSFTVRHTEFGTTYNMSSADVTTTSQFTGTVTFSNSGVSGHESGILVSFVGDGT